ncbi:hypothetical protein [Pseudoalteromonas distincta]|uniref:hypothetical protein n=1 Tax=Pseudoalteromonas distincta TaxID=77608 RepID=UPI001869D90F|nr:hypothetical protein [Pseudoalteromonas distincta]MBE3672538.1 hypothetical protein [Pseudoalteromonas distincta KMM 3548]
MKLFKKALLATAIFGAMGANAADVSDAVKFTSVEGFAVANGTLTDDRSVRVIVREKLEAGDRITLQFGKGFDSITGVEAYPTAAPFALASGNIAINNGTADYTFTVDAAESDFAKGKVVLELDTGYTVELDESFEVVVAADTFAATATQSNATVTYSAVSWQDGSAKDTTGDNTGTFLKFKNQYTATVKTALDGVIERKDGVKFISGFPTGAEKTDTLVLTLNDNTDLLDAVAANTTVTTFKLAGDFSDMVAGDATATASGDILTSDVAVTAISPSLLTFTVTDSAGEGQDGEVVLTLDNATRVAVPERIKATSFALDGSVNYGLPATASVFANASAGKWIVDATIINVPYFPVGFEGVSTSVHFANEGSSDVNVIMTAIDDSGEEYAAVDMGDLAGDTVTKYTQGDIMKAFGITAKTKLSVTFNIDATDGVVNAYAFSNAGTGRQALVTSQQTK